MSISVRYNEYTNAEATSGVVMPGKELAENVVKVKLPAIAVNNDADVFTWAGGGTIKDIVAVQIWKATGALRSGDTQAQAPIFTISADGKTINIAIPNAGGAAIANTDILKMRIVAGY